MKPSSTLSLGLIMAIGMAGAASAQAMQGSASPAAPQGTVPNQTSTWNPSHPLSSSATEPGGTGAANGQAGVGAAQPAPSATGGPAANVGGANTNPQTPTSMAQTRTGGDPSVMQAQQRLQAAGLYSGPIDGVMDPDTRAAIARFQEQNGLRRTERLDSATVARLNQSATSGYGSSTAEPRSSAPSGSAPTGNTATRPQ